MKEKAAAHTGMMKPLENVTAYATSISLHLEVLRERGMVVTERRGTGIVYSLGDACLIHALDLLRMAMQDIPAKPVEIIQDIV